MIQATGILGLASPDHEGRASFEAFTLPNAPRSCIVYTSALKGLPCNNFGVHVYHIKLHGAFATVGLELEVQGFWA